MIPTVIIKPIQKIVLPVFMMPIPNMIKLYFEDSNINDSVKITEVVET